MMILFRISAPHFVAGFEYDSDKKVCISAAPIFNWMVGESGIDIWDYCKRNSYKLEIVKSNE